MVCFRNFFILMFFKVNTFFIKPCIFSKKSKIFFLFIGLWIPFATCGQTKSKDVKTNVFFGKASYYDEYFNGRHTANGEVFSHKLLTAAHPSWPFNTKVRITNLANSNSVIVRINDRGPFIHGRHIDVTKQAAKVLGFIKAGVVDVKMEVLTWGKTTDSSYAMIVKPSQQNIATKKEKKSDSKVKANSASSVKNSYTNDSTLLSDNLRLKPTANAKTKTDKISLNNSSSASDTTKSANKKTGSTKNKPIVSTTSKSKVTKNKVVAKNSFIMCTNSDSLSGWCVQVGCYGNKSNAQRTLNKVIETTQEWACIQEIHRNDLPYYRIVCGKNIENKKAAEIKQKLSGIYPDAFITNYTVLLNNSTSSK